ncbi:hypothetical protein [Halosaccharopolyspora lacisalsi]|uniref:hypothetical protein n=1 Tax=Halosaccharopolyspora lacisalsi TaxID=1000566 RepID=UPI0015F979B0|nr:hypothetical protein [Halosaccharopolyspora lacisalsi]
MRSSAVDSSEIRGARASDSSAPEKDRSSSATVPSETASVVRNSRRISSASSARDGNTLSAACSTSASRTSGATTIGWPNALLGTSPVHVSITTGSVAVAAPTPRTPLAATTAPATPVLAARRSARG